MESSITVSELEIKRSKEKFWLHWTTISYFDITFPPTNMAEHGTLQPPDMIKEIVRAVDGAGDELWRLSLEVCQNYLVKHEEKSQTNLRY
jgi:hypothetical protein